LKSHILKVFLKNFFKENFFIFKALTPEKTDLKQKEEKLEIDQKDYETIDIDAEPITENFGVIAYEEFPFPTDNLFISFKNLKINYTIILPTPNGICPLKTKMFVFVPSRADGFYTRHMIRNSWGANLVWKFFFEFFDKFYFCFLGREEVFFN